MDVPDVFDAEGHALINENVENDSVTMSRSKWYEFVEYIICTEENKKALEVYFDY